MTENQSLGEILMSSKNKFENDKVYAMKVKLEKEGADAKEKIDTVTDFFNRAKNSFSNQIISGCAKLKPMVLSSRKEYEAYVVLKVWNWNGSINSIESNKHMFHPLWVEFKDWCLENGLIPSFDYCHDGVGVESWFELIVSPKV